MASAKTMSYQDTLDSQYLSTSLSSLSQSRSTNSLIVRTYKQATHFYLTKRFRDALDTLEPIISPQRDSLDSAVEDGSASDTGPAPVAQSSRGTRTKVWVFYLTLLNSILDLGLEDGRNTFGSARWKALAAKVSDGSIWDEVVRRGYGGSEGDVDPDVVVNLATLLLRHMQDQRLTQQRLEAFLAASDVGAHGHLSWAQDGASTPMSNSSSSPKMLATRLHLLELYALHVLPANSEWEYAASFIEMNETLDEERREAFLHALQTVKAERDGTAQRERELQEQRERELEQRRQAETARLADEARAQEARRRAAEEADRAQHALSKSVPNSNATIANTPQPPPTIGPAGRPAKPVRKGAGPPVPAPPPTLFRRASAALNNLQNMLLHASRNLNLGSVALLRLLMFTLAFLVLIARQDLRLKLQRTIDQAWRKLKQTVGMGVKVSYI